MSTLPPELPIAIRLACGERCGFHGLAGVRVQAGVGALRLAGPPAWLAETLVMPERSLAPGACLVLESSGWYEAAALADTCLSRATGEVPQPPLLRRLWLLCGAAADQG